MNNHSDGSETRFMNTLTFKTNVNCEGCLKQITPYLNEAQTISDWNIDLSNPEKTLTAVAENLDAEEVISIVKEAGYEAAILNKSGCCNSAPVKKVESGFWRSSEGWRRAARNTLNCLIGCSIGDFGMIIFLQAKFPATPVMTQMILAIIAGLCTSIALETIILKKKEQFPWKLAFKTAFSMSFISMIAMEIVMNITDFMITGATADFSNPIYWLALVVAMIAGFLAPLPYNYYKLVKFGKACH